MGSEMCIRDSVNAKDDDGKSPLHLTDSKEVAQTLIDNGAEVNAIDSFHQTPLHGAQKDKALVLIQEGADLEGCTSRSCGCASRLCFHSTPLEVAYRERDFDLIEFLLNKGADIRNVHERYRVDQYDQSVLYWKF